MDVMQLVCIKPDPGEDAPLKPSILSATESILLQCVSTLIIPSSIISFSTALYYWFDHLGASPYSITMEQVLQIFRCYLD